MYGIFILAIVTVFVAGLMAGRTPDYIGKKIRPTEMRYAALYFLTCSGHPDHGGASATGDKFSTDRILTRAFEAAFDGLFFTFMVANVAGRMLVRACGAEA